MADQKEVQASTTPSFVAALVTAAVTVGACCLFWLVFHGIKSLKRVYQPRTVLAPPDKRAEGLPRAPLAWWQRVLTLDDTEVLYLNGPDAYFFLRFLKVFGLYCMVPYVFFTIAVCVPASVAKPNNGLDGLNVMTFGNAPTQIPTRRIAHLLVAVILMLWTLYLIWHEYNHFMEVRLNWLRSDRNSTKSRTIALVNVPESMFSEAGIREIGSSVANVASQPRMSDVGNSTVKPTGGISKVWLARKVKPVEKVYTRRDKEVSRLEGGVGKLLKLANKNQRKGKTPEAKGTWDKESAGSIVDRYVLPKKQPTWKQGFLGLIGTKMNLQTSPEYIKEQNELLERERARIDELPEGNVAFVRFERQEDAHNFARLAPKSDKALRMMVTKIEVYPEDIVWSNTSMSWPQRKARTAASWALTIGLIIVWAIPVAFVGMVSNVDALCETVPFLKWLCNPSIIPPAALGIIKGVLPPALMAVLFMLLPIVLRIWIKLQGEIRQSEINLHLFTRYWCFWVIHGFLITTMASGLISALSNIKDTMGSIPTLLANKLPGASIYFLTFILVSSWAAAAKIFARIFPVVKWHLRGLLAGGTPRKAYVQKYDMSSFDWATVWPPVCLLSCIVVVYSVIQPLITVIGMVGFVLFYAAYKYAISYTADQSPELETGGLFYIKALRTLFVSLYIEQVFLAGLFFLSSTSSEKDANGNKLPDPQKNSRLGTGIACGVIIVIVGVITALTQAWIDHFRFKRNTLLYGVRGTGLISTSQTQLNATEKTVSSEPKSPIEELADENEFNHPALWKPQPVVWIADDPLGLGRYEAEQINAAGVEASVQYAHMNEKGDLSVDRSPPDEEWENRPYDEE